MICILVYMCYDIDFVYFYDFLIGHRVLEMFRQYGFFFLHFIDMNYEENISR